MRALCNLSRIVRIRSSSGLISNVDLMLHACNPHPRPYYPVPRVSLVEFKQECCALQSFADDEVRRHC